MKTGPRIHIEIIIKISLVAFFFILWPGLVQAGPHLHPEKWYQEKWCMGHGGRVEAVLPDRTRCDCLTDTHAIEFDFGPKWAEAIGQALYYGVQTGKRPGIVLILERPEDRKYWIRLNSVIQHYGLAVETWELENETIGNHQQWRGNSGD